MLNEKALQTAEYVLMIRPMHFGFNSETASTNAFQKSSTVSSIKIKRRAIAEFERFKKKLISKGIKVITFNDRPGYFTPDSIFVNNWVSFHRDGRVVLYPMYAENRRLERRIDIINSLSSKFGFIISNVSDFTHFEAEGKFLEGTGSLVLDDVSKTAYVCISPRTDPTLAEKFGKELGYNIVKFHAVDKNNLPVYHTNVVMSIGEGFAVICLESIPKKEERDNISKSLKRTGHKIIQISLNQMYKFAGNILELRNAKDERFLVISKTAFDSLRKSQISSLSKYAKLLVSDISTIEKYGGGSVRCMLSEIKLPRAR